MPKPIWKKTSPLSGVSAEARRRSLRVTGTLGTLRAAAERGLIHVPEILTRLRETSFYVDDKLIRSIFDEWLTSS
jgi:predicted nucleic acid-binding protein